MKYGIKNNMLEITHDPQVDLISLNDIQNKIDNIIAQKAILDTQLLDWQDKLTQATNLGVQRTVTNGI